MPRTLYDLAGDLDRLKSKARKIHNEALELEAKPKSSGRDERLANLSTALDRIKADEAALRPEFNAAGVAAVAVGLGEHGFGGGTEQSSGRTLTGERGEGLRAIQNSTAIPDQAKEKATRLIESGDDNEALPAAMTDRDQ